VPGTGGKKPMARIKSAGESYEVEADKIKILGRVRGGWRKV
jgi:hypothetical protein